MSTQQKQSKIDIVAAANAFQTFLLSIGVDNSAGIDIAESAANTASLMADWMRGLHEDSPALSLMPAPNHCHDLVTIEDLPFYSFCGHHFVPFFGTVTIDYYPGEFIAGLGGFIRIIDYYSRRPQFQENLCAQIADHINKELMPNAVRVRIAARQMCVELHENANHSIFKSEAIRSINDHYKTLLLSR